MSVALPQTLTELVELSEDGLSGGVVETRQHQADLQGFGQRLRSLRRDAGLTQAQLGARVGYHPSLISKFESAERVPSPTLVRLLDDLLDAGGHLIGRFDAPVGTAQKTVPLGPLVPLLSSVHPTADRPPAGITVTFRRWPITLPHAGVFCPLHPATGCLVPSAGHCLAATDAISSRRKDADSQARDPDLVHAIAGLLAALTDRSDESGANTVVEPALAQVENLLEGLISWCRDVNAGGGPIRAPLQLASGYAQLAARLHMLLGHNALAMSWMQHSLTWADASRDTILRAAVHADMCTLVRLDQHGTSSLTYANALGSLDPKRNWVAALAHTHRARAHAPSGDLRAVDRELSSARRRLGRMTEQDLREAPWMVGESGDLRVAAAAGAALRDVSATTGDRATARRAVYASRRSLSLLPSRMLPSRLLFTTRLADSYACAGEPEAAVTLMAEVLPQAGLGHASLRSEIRGLRLRLRPWHSIPEVAELDARLSVTCD